MIVGHLPREISRATKYLLDRGAIVTATITPEHYRKSPLFQDVLPQIYEQFVKTLYAEPKDEVIVGSYFTEKNLSVVLANDGFVQRRKRTQRAR